MSDHIHQLETDIRTLDDPYVVMAVGVPGSGKTTVLEEVASGLSVARISSDDIREELTGDAANQGMNKEVWQQVHARVEATLALSHSAIVDATHYEGFRRRQDTALYRSFGAQALAAAVFVTPYGRSKEQNKQRTDRAAVPHWAMDRMNKALMTDRVSTDEGFDRIFIVRPPRLVKPVGSGVQRVATH